jgi:hypothetical protein
MLDLNEEIKKQDKLWQDYLDQRNLVNDLKIKDIKDEYLYTFIKYHSGLLDEETPRYSYLFINNIWYSSSEHILFVEGMGFNSNISEYADDTWFLFNEDIQERMHLYDFREDECQSPFYHITRIDETEFRNAFQDQLNKIRTEFNNLEFEHEDIKI